MRNTEKEPYNHAATMQTSGINVTMRRELKIGGQLLRVLQLGLANRSFVKNLKTISSHLIIMKIIYILIITANMVFADDFKSITEIRSEMNHQKYGPSLDEVLPFDRAKEIKIVACFGYKTESAISEDYAYSNLSGAGREKFVFNFCEYTNTFNLSSPITNTEFKLTQWSKPLSASPILINSIYECLKVVNGVKMQGAPKAHHVTPNQK